MTPFEDSIEEKTKKEKKKKRGCEIGGNQESKEKNYQYKLFEINLSNCNA